MHIALALTTLLAAFDPPGPVPAAPPAAVEAADPCAAQASMPREPACGSAPLCGARERVRVACELREAVRTRYVFLESKGTLLGKEFDASSRLDACVTAERSIAREDEPLRFYDRIRACMGGFEDGHLIVTAPQRLPQVALGVGLRRAGGRIVVASREAGLRGLVGDAAADALPVGAEVLEIDGMAAADAAAALARMVPGSSAAARLERAVDALTRRDFDHPQRRTATLTVALASGGRRTVELPWWVSPGADRHAVAGEWARRVRLPSTDRLPWFDDAARPRRGAPVEGAPAWAPVVPAAAAASLREYADDAGRIAARLGAVEAGAAQPYCYLQLLTFHTEGLTGPDGVKRPYAAVIESFVRGCGEKGRDLVLDLRRNEGGYLDHSTAVAEALAPPGAPGTAAALLLRATERNEAVYRERSGSAPPAEDSLAPRHILDAIGAARRDGRTLTPAFVAGAGGGAGSGFQGRVVALTSPACMSACDRLAALLKASGRAVLVGGPTEGAGGSQQETPGVPAKWTDSARLLSVAIPNASFGVRRAPAGLVVTAAEGAAAEPARIGPEVPAPVFFEAFGIENHPIEPDVRYDTRADDVTGGGRGWLEQVDAILTGSPLAAAAGRFPVAG